MKSAAIDTAIRLRKRKIIESYIEWKVCDELEIMPLASPRLCLENIFKALVTREFGITEFTKGNYNKLKIVEEYRRNCKLPVYESAFSVYLCSKLLEPYYPFNKQLDDGIKNIQKCGNIHMHEVEKPKDEDIQKISNQLYQLVDWFFQNEKETDWLKLVSNKVAVISDGVVIQIIDKVSQKIEEIVQQSQLQGKELNIISPEILEEVKQKYFKYLDIVCGKIQFEVFATGKKSGTSKVPLENSFISIPLIDFEKSEKINWRECERIGINEILANERRLAIIAHAGSGKSTLIKSIAIAYANPERRSTIFGPWNVKEGFPLYIRCREIGGKTMPPIIDIINRIPNRGAFTNYSIQFEHLVISRLETGEAVLLIDGFDEIIGDGSRNEFLQQLEIFSEIYPDISIILTSREAAFREFNGSPKIINNFTKYKVSPLIDTEIRELSIKWHKAINGDNSTSIKEGIEVSDTINKKKEYSLLAENPLLLTSLLLVKSEKGSLPTDRETLYSETIKVLVSAWNLEGHSHEQLDYDETELQLAYTAYWMSINGRQTINETELVQCLSEVRKGIDRKLDYSIKDFIKRVEMRTGLLRLTGDFQYEFLHLSFQEYLTATIIVNNYLHHNPDPAALLVEIINHSPFIDDWGDVALMVIKLLKSSNEVFLDYLLKKAKEITRSEAEKVWAIFSLPEEERKKILDKNDEPEFRTLLLKFFSVSLLGYCIEKEIEMGQLLEEAIEWVVRFSNQRFYKTHSVNLIFRSKYGNLVKKIVRNCYFNSTSHPEGMVRPLLNKLQAIVFDDYTQKNTLCDYSTITENIDILDIKSSFRSIKNNISCNDKEKICLNLLRISMDWSLYFPELAGMYNGTETFAETRKELKEGIEDIFNYLWHTNLISINDFHYFNIIGWVILEVISKWYFLNDLNHISYSSDEENLSFANKECIKYFIENWINSDQYNIHYYSSIVLCNILRPDLDHDWIKSFPGINDAVTRNFQTPQFEANKTASIWLGILIGLKWEPEEIEKFLEGSYQRIGTLKFEEALGLKIRYNDSNK